MEYSYRFRLYPNKAQEELICKTFGCCRFVWNHYLAMRQEVYNKTKKTMSYNECSANLTKLKKTLPWLYEVDSHALQQSLRDLDTAYKNFFSRVTRGRKCGYPKFKRKKERHQSYRATGTIRVEGNAIRLPKLGLVKCKVSKRVDGRILNATVSRRPSGKYYVSLCCTDVEIEPLPSTGKMVGIDMGVRVLATDSNGSKYPNPKYLGKSLKKLVRLQRQLSRKVRGSANWEKQRVKVARLQEYIAAQRNDAMYKLTTQLVRENDLICIEDLDIQQMLQGTGIGIKRHQFNRSLMDTALGEFRRQLEYKAAWYGKQVIKVGREFPSSQLCSDCGAQNAEIEDLHMRKWECPACGTIHDRDINAAKNILNEGLRLLA